MTKASLISLIYSCIMNLRTGAEKGQAVTLMGTDCDALDLVGLWCYDILSYSLEAGVALMLIYRVARDIFLITLSFILRRLFYSLYI